MRPPSTTSGPVPALSKPLVYAVDDDPMMASLLEAILKNPEYELKVFRDPQAMLQAFLSAVPKPAIIITDFAMGSVNGLEVIARCKEAHPGVKTVLISGSVDSHFARLSAAKPDKFLAKPFQSKALIETVRSLMH